MGIPKFFRWMSERYPMCSQLITENRIPEFDNLYLDMNGIIHNSSHNNNDSAHFRITEEQIWIGIFNYVDHVFNKIKPKKVFFLAIDGVAPRAKMNQQRARRFRTAKDAEDTRRKALARGEELPDEDPFDSNCITPGTVFMKKLTKQLRYFITKKVSEDALWRDVEIILSGPEVPGEGEHKIMEYIRLSKAQPDYDPNTRHCLYGLDADLIMLGLLTHDPHFALLREEVTFGRKTNKNVSLDAQNFYLMHLSVLREYLDMEFQPLKESLQFDYDLERILDDFILLALFVGNDFLPHLPDLHINEGALGLMFNVYKKVLPTTDGYIQDGGNVSMKRLELILAELAKTVEQDAFQAEMVSSAYFDGDMEKLDKLEKKKKNKKNKHPQLILTPNQRELFDQIKAFVLAHKPGKSEALHFASTLDAVDRKFVESAAKDLGVASAIEYSNEDDSKHVYIEFNDSDDDDDAPSEIDDEAMAAVQRVLNRYENAPIVTPVSAEDVKKENKEKLEKEFRDWRAAYYMDKMKIDMDKPEELEPLVKAYVTGIQWVLRYYYEGVASWGWFYPFHYAPKISDLVNLSKYQDHPFELGQPFKPFEQLMGVLPALSKKLLPVAYQELMTDAASPIIDFYPRDFDLDMNGKKQDWEAVILIPFIDESRLLEAMQRKEARLTQAERDMVRVGDTYRFVFDKAMADADEEHAVTYPSPLPNVFPAIHHCCAREVIYTLPKLGNGVELRKHLLEGAKHGKEALAGFPSLATIPYSSSLEFHNVRVFQQESRNETMVVRIHDRFANMSTEQIAQAVLYKRVFVHYPYLQEAVVVAVSNETTKYTLRVAGKKRAVLANTMDDDEQKEWNKQVGKAEYMSSRRFGLEIGATTTALHVCTLRGMKRTEDGALIKEYVNPAQEEVVPVQASVIKVVHEDPRYKEQKAPAVQDSYPLRSKVYFLGDVYYGSQATVIGHGDNSVDIEMYVPLDRDHATQPAFGSEALDRQMNDVPYFNSQRVAERVGCNTLTLSKITSALQITDTSTQRVNVGLCLKFEARQQKVIGYTRRNGPGQWEYSKKAVNLIQEYVKTFPKFVKLVQDAGNGKGFLKVEDFIWTTSGHDELKRMRRWIKDKGIDSLPRASLTDEQFDDSVIQFIEGEATAYQTWYENLDFKKLRIKGIPRKVLLRPQDADSKLQGQLFRLGDRVVYVKDSGAVPMDAKGTVVGVEEKLVDVVFDQPFMSGQDLGGRCSEFRGMSLPAHALINLSVPQFSINAGKTGTGTTGKAAGGKKGGNQPLNNTTNRQQQQQQQGDGRRSQQQHKQQSNGQQSKQANRKQQQQPAGNAPDPQRILKRTS